MVVIGFLFFFFNFAVAFEVLLILSINNLFLIKRYKYVTFRFGELQTQLSVHLVKIFFNDIECANLIPSTSEPFHWFTYCDGLLVNLFIYLS